MFMKKLIGKKKGMTQIFDEAGALIPVTVLELGPCCVVQLKTQEKDGYAAMQIGFEELPEKKATKPYAGHFKKANTKIYKYLCEVELDGERAVGDVLTLDQWTPGSIVNVTAISRGKGFQGVIKRHGKAGGPASHGSRFHRTTGSIGQRTSPGEVFKNMKLPGRMGNDRVTTKGLKVARVDADAHLVFLKGSVPGGKDNLVIVGAA